MRILVLNGPNLNLLGRREPDVYGAATLDDIEAALRRRFPHVHLLFFQSNHEGALLDRLHEAGRDGDDGSGTDGVVFNPGGYTHTSVALRDAIAAIGVPVIEVHLSNVHAREDFRRTSLLAPVCRGTIAGLGAAGYAAAVEALVRPFPDAEGEGRADG